jgi:hypothetical protein
VGRLPWKVGRLLALEDAINAVRPRASAVRSNRHGPKNDTEVVARCGETSPLNKRLIQGLRFRNQPTKSHQNGTLRGKNGVDDVEQQI